MTDYTRLERALMHLKFQLANHLAAPSRTELTDLDRDGIAESVIQRFETAYDTLWKTLKRHLSAELGVVVEVYSPKGVFRIAGESMRGWEGTGRWLEYADARTACLGRVAGELSGPDQATLPGTYAASNPVNLPLQSTPPAHRPSFHLLFLGGGREFVPVHQLQVGNRSGVQHALVLKGGLHVVVR